MPGERPAWHALATAAVAGRLGTDVARGLGRDEAARRLEEHGPNEVAREKRRSLVVLFLRQLRDFMILVLLAAAAVSGVIGEPQDTLAIVVIVLLNAVMGAVQEFRAERAVAALRAMAAPAARVLREGRRLTLESSVIVPGDLVVLEAGDVVPADLRLVETAELLTDESVLTGESHGVEKSTAALDAVDAPIQERVNLAFKGSLVSRGRGLGVVVATGKATEIGRIAELLRGEAGVRTPLQRRLTRFGRYLALATLAICAVVFTAGLLQGQPAMLMFLTAVSLAVAAIPEALPAVVTVSLALGARTLSRHDALVRRLPAVETLGSVTTICADKTGTLTQNRMSAEVLLADGERRSALPEANGATPPWALLARAMAISNDVGWAEGRAAGEPTEVALAEAAHRAGYAKVEIEPGWPRVAELAFESGRRSMATLHAHDGRIEVFVKGAPEAILEHCADQLTASGRGALDHARVLDEAEAMASEGHRVLALAWRELATLPGDVSPETVERELTLLGLVGLIDPPRPEVPGSVAECQNAGITPIMITGDHPGTARAIAERLGIADDGQDVLTGEHLSRLSDEDLARAAESARVYARVSPEQKTRIVKALQANGELVAMTGDGVNDAPALKRAGIGIAMGRRGTDVAREAADMVLLDDDFSTIVRAVRLGRRIFDNIRKFIKDTMSSNSGEIWTLFLAPFLGLPVPLLPIHILWINLVTDGLPGLAFAAERAEPGLMQRPPRPPRESIFAHGMWQHIVWVGLFVGGISIASQAWAIGRSLEHWQTVVFSVLTISQLFHSMAVRSERASLFEIGITTNPAMLSAVLLALALQLAVVYLPVFQPIFHTQALPLADLLVVLALSSLVLVAVELEKWLVRRGWIYGSAQG